jgi:hypothetical protein
MRSLRKSTKNAIAQPRLRRATIRSRKAAYSGTPFAKEPGIKLQLGIQLLNVPPEVGAELKEDLAGCRVAKSGKLDLAIIFVTNQETWRKSCPLWTTRAGGDAAGGLAEKESGVVSDLTENGVRRIRLSAGWVDVKACAVSEIWSG